MIYKFTRKLIYLHVKQCPTCNATTLHCNATTTCLNMCKHDNTAKRIQRERGC